MGVCSNIYVYDKFPCFRPSTYLCKEITAKEMLKNLYRQNSEIEDVTSSIKRKYAKRFFSMKILRLLYFLIVCILRNYIVNCRPCYLSGLY